MLTLEWGQWNKMETFEVWKLSKWPHCPHTWVITKLNDSSQNVSRATLAPTSATALSGIRNTAKTTPHVPISGPVSTYCVEEFIYVPNWKNHEFMQLKGFWPDQL